MLGLDFGLRTVAVGQIQLPPPYDVPLDHLSGTTLMLEPLSHGPATIGTASRRGAGGWRERPVVFERHATSSRSPTPRHLVYCTRLTKVIVVSGPTSPATAFGSVAVILMKRACTSHVLPEQLPE